MSTCCLGKRGKEEVHKIYIEHEITYDGTQLSSHWAYRTFGLLGDVILAFQGPCRVGLNEMVDLADVREGAYIDSPRMLHFLVEHFDQDLERAVLRQRLLVALAGEILSWQKMGEGVRRRGDDLFLGERKLSVSIATISPVSALIHFGLNIFTEGTPVPTVGLVELEVEPGWFAQALMDAYLEENQGIREAYWKVRWVP